MAALDPGACGRSACGTRGARGLHRRASVRHGSGPKTAPARVRFPPVDPGMSSSGWSPGKCLLPESDAPDGRPVRPARTRCSRTPRSPSSSRRCFEASAAASRRSRRASTPLDAERGHAVRRSGAARPTWACNQPFAVCATFRPPAAPTALADDDDPGRAPPARTWSSSRAAEDRGPVRATLVEQHRPQTVTPPGARRLARWLAYPLLDRRDAITRAPGCGWPGWPTGTGPGRRLREALARDVRDPERLLSRRRFVRRSDASGAGGCCAASLAGAPRAWRRRSSEDDVGEGMLVVAEATDGPPALPRCAEPVPDVVHRPPGGERSSTTRRSVPKGSRGANETGYIRRGLPARSSTPCARAGRQGARVGRRARGPGTRAHGDLQPASARFHPVHGYSLEVTKANLARVPEDWRAQADPGECGALHHRRSCRERAGPDPGLHRARGGAGARDLRGRCASAGPGADCGGDPRCRRARVAESSTLSRPWPRWPGRDGWVRPEVVDDGERLEIRGRPSPGRSRPILARSGGRLVRPQRHGARPRGPARPDPDPAGDGAEHVRQEHLSASGGAPGAPGADRQLRSRRDSAHVGIVDRVFTRVGASDRLARGESTFMVEMRETADILGPGLPAQPR